MSPLLLSVSYFWRAIVMRNSTMMIYFFIQIIITMKKYGSSSKKKKREFVDDRSGEETVTPRVKRSHSVTNTKYLQLQLDTSGKKRENIEKNIAVKEKRIQELEREVKEQQEYIISNTIQAKDVSFKWEYQKGKNQRLQKEMRQAVDLCKSMKNKCRQLIDRNEDLIKSEGVAQHQLQVLQKEHKELKEKRRRQKRELRDLILPLLVGLSQSNASSQQLQKISKML